MICFYISAANFSKYETFSIAIQQIKSQCCLQTSETNIKSVTGTFVHFAIYYCYLAKLQVMELENPSNHIDQNTDNKW